MSGVPPAAQSALYKRQTDATASPAAASSTSKPFPVAAIVIPIAIGGAFLVGLIFWSWNRKLRAGVPPRSQQRTAGGSTTADGDSQRPSLPRRFLRSLIATFHVERPDLCLVHNHSQGIAPERPTSSNAVAAEARARQRSQRRQARHNNDQLRRTESGRSILTVPEYKSEITEGEVMLYKASDASVLDSMDALADHVDDDEQEASGGETTPSAARQAFPHSIAAGLRNSLRRSINRRGSRASRASSQRSDHNERAQRHDDIADAVLPEMVELGSMEDLTEEDEESRGSAVTLPRPDVPIATLQQEHSETPAYEELFPASESPAPTSTPTAMSAQTPSTPRGLRGFFRSHRPSRSSPNAPSLLPLTVTRSADSSQSDAPGARSHRRFQSSASVLSTLSRGGNNGSTQDLTPSVSADRRISQPLRNTLVHMTSSQPLNEDQMRFLGSVESLGRYGVPFDGNASSTRPSIDLSRPRLASNASAQRPSLGSQEASQPDAIPPPMYDHTVQRPPPLLLASETVAERQALPHVATTVTSTEAEAASAVPLPISP